jgi:hypothetical protein
MALKHLNSESNSIYQLGVLRITSARSQVVAGIKYEMNLEVAQSTSCLNNNQHENQHEQHWQRPSPDTATHPLYQMFMGQGSTSGCTVDMSTQAQYTAVVVSTPWKDPPLQVVSVAPSPASLFMPGPVLFPGISAPLSVAAPLSTSAVPTTEISTVELTTATIGNATTSVEASSNGAVEMSSNMTEASAAAASPVAPATEPAPYTKGIKWSQEDVQKRCGDDSMVICMLLPMCQDGEFRVSVHGCYACVNPLTCPPNGDAAMVPIKTSTVELATDTSAAISNASIAVSNTTSDTVADAATSGNYTTAQGTLAALATKVAFLVPTPPPTAPTPAPPTPPPSPLTWKEENASVRVEKSAMHEGATEQWAVAHEDWDQLKTGEEKAIEVEDGRDGCAVVTNGGFFNPETGACLGNLISEGKIVRLDEHRRTVQMGMREGNYVVGYLTPEELTSTEHPFEELISGLVWLVRDGESHVDEDVKYSEDMSIQTTGDSFVTVKSARTAVGFDKEGRIMVLQMDGKTWERGLDLREMAKLLIRLGAWQAINLDGGGSGSMSVYGEMISTPTEACHAHLDEDGGMVGAFTDPILEKGDWDKYFRCEKEVGTITCIHSAPHAVGSSGEDGAEGKGAVARESAPQGTTAQGGKEAAMQDGLRVAKLQQQVQKKKDKLTKLKGELQQEEQETKAADAKVAAMKHEMVTLHMNQTALRGQLHREQQAKLAAIKELGQSMLVLRANLTIESSARQKAEAALRLERGVAAQENRTEQRMEKKEQYEEKEQAQTEAVAVVLARNLSMSAKRRKSVERDIVVVNEQLVAARKNASEVAVAMSRVQLAKMRAEARTRRAEEAKTAEHTLRMRSEHLELYALNLTNKAVSRLQKIRVQNLHAQMEARAATKSAAKAAAKQATAEEDSERMKAKLYKAEQAKTAAEMSKMEEANSLAEAKKKVVSKQVELQHQNSRDVGITTVLGACLVVSLGFNLALWMRSRASGQSSSGGPHLGRDFRSLAPGSSSENFEMGSVGGEYDDDMELDFDEDFDEVDEEGV